jgi:hypothetical protein
VLFFVSIIYLVSLLFGFISEFYLVESPVVAVNGSGGAEANLIASSITRLSRALVAWILKMKDSLASSSSGTSETRVMSEVGLLSFLSIELHPANKKSFGAFELGS